MVAKKLWSLVIAGFGMIFLLLSDVGSADVRSGARTEIERQNVAFAAAFNRGDIAAVGPLYAEDAIVLPPDSEWVSGRSAIEAYWNGAWAAGMRNVKLEIVDVTVSGDLAVEVGRASFEIQAPGQPPIAQVVKYLVAWQHQPDGSWRLLRDIWNALPAPS